VNGDSKIIDDRDESLLNVDANLAEIGKDIANFIKNQNRLIKTNQEKSINL
jgi:hypothetical protein